MLGSKGIDACPADFHSIPDEAECQRAADALGLNTDFSHAQHAPSPDAECFLWNGKKKKDNMVIRHGSGDTNCFFPENIHDR